MGGLGSGNGWQTASKGTCEMSHRVDLRYLSRHNMLRPGYAGSLNWWIGGERSGGIQIRAHVHSLQLDYRFRPYGETDWQVVSEHVWYGFTEQNFGGSRRWFLCPGCHGRCLVLYGGHYFRCRQCKNLVYQSQREDIYDRASRRARKIRAILGEPNGSFDDPLPPRPKGMHWKTYAAFCHECECLEQTVAEKMTWHMERLFGVA